MMILDVLPDMFIRCNVQRLLLRLLSAGSPAQDAAGLAEEVNCRRVVHPWAGAEEHQPSFAAILPEDPELPLYL